MKLIHLSDLHIGKRVNEFSMVEDQAYILTEILGIIDAEQPDGVMIAGDIYDKSVPSTEAVQLFDDFLVRLSQRALKVFVISGNHDSAERIAFGSRLMNSSGVYMSPVYDGSVQSVSMDDEFGTLNVFMLPFLKPSHVRRYFPEEKIESYTEAMRTVIEQMGVNTQDRNVLITHQFVTGALRCDSEEISVGGSDNVESSVFEPFDYTALGHIHSPQSVGRDNIRYCGTPLKYSFSEVNHKKSVTVVELFEKGNITVRTVPLTAKRDLKELRGTYMEVTAKSFYEGLNTDDYMHITLTDEEDIVEAMGKLRAIYPNIMKLDYDNQRTRMNGSIGMAENVESKAPIELLAEFYEKQNNKSLSEEQYNFVESMIQKIWEGQK